MPTDAADLIQRSQKSTPINAADLIQGIQSSPPIYAAGRIQTKQNTRIDAVQCYKTHIKMQSVATQSKTTCVGIQQTTQGKKRPSEQGWGSDAKDGGKLPSW